MPIHLEDLPVILAAGCETPGCSHKHGEIRLAQRCHPGHGVDVVVVPGKDVIEVRCRTCEKLVTEIAVKPKPK